jgi:transposase
VHRRDRGPSIWLLAKGHAIAAVSATVS